MANKRIEILIDIVADKAGSLKKLRTEMQQTEGVVGKFKVGVKGLGDSFRSAAANPAVLASGVAAVGAAAVAAVDKFADLGLAVGQFSDATGTTATEASRLLEVESSLGIASGTLESSIGKMAKALGANEEAFARYGVSVVRAIDGTVDANETFIRTIGVLGKIADPLKQSEAASKIFGRSWQSMAEIISGGSQKLRDDLSSVADEQVLDESDVQDAREYRESMDELGDAFGRIALKVGKQLLPVLDTVVDTATDIVGAFEPLTDSAAAWHDALTDDLNISGKDEILSLFDAADNGNVVLDGLHERALRVSESTHQMGEAARVSAERAAELTENVHHTGEAAREGADRTDQLAASIHHAGEAAREGSEFQGRFSENVHHAGEAARETASAMDALEQSTDNATEAYNEFIGILDAEDAWADAQQAVADYNATLKDSEASQADIDQAFRDTQRELAEYVNALTQISPEQKTWIIAEIEKGNIPAVMAELATIPTQQEVDIWVAAEQANKDIGAMRGLLEEAGVPVTADIEADVEAGNLDAALRKMRELLAMNGKKVKVAVGSLGYEKLANGSRSTDGMPAIIGENGPGITTIVAPKSCKVA